MNQNFIIFKKIFFSFFAFSLLFYSCTNSVPVAPETNITGKGGSLARFTIVNDYLYIAEMDSLKIVNIHIPENPIQLTTIWLTDLNDIETIYSFKDLLFIGSQTGMYIYSIINPESPEFLGGAHHITACDPVVANDSMAFVTIRNGTSCNPFFTEVNQLKIYNITNINKPVEIYTVNLFNPHGLAVNSNALYVCDYTNGLVTFDVSDPYHPKLINTQREWAVKDCIVKDNLLICMSLRGMVIFDISDQFNPVFITEVF